MIDDLYFKCYCSTVISGKGFEMGQERYQDDFNIFFGSVCGPENSWQQENLMYKKERETRGEGMLRSPGPVSERSQRTGLDSVVGTHGGVLSVFLIMGGA